MNNPPSIKDKSYRQAYAYASKKSAEPAQGWKGE